MAEYLYAWSHESMQFSNFFSKHFVASKNDDSRYTSRMSGTLSTKLNTDVEISMSRKFKIRKHAVQLTGFVIIAIYAVTLSAGHANAQTLWPKPVTIGVSCRQLNEDGKILPDAKSEWIGAPGQGGLAIFYSDGRFGYLGRDGKVQIAAQFERAGDFDESGLAMVMQNGLWGFINTVGHFEIKPVFGEAVPFGMADLTPARIGRWIPPASSSPKTNGPYGFINKKGEFVVKAQFFGAGLFDSSGLARVSTKTDGIGRPTGWGYIDSNGRLAIAPRFVEAGAFGENALAAVKLVGGDFDGKFGYISRAGKMMIEPQFSIAKPFDKRGLAWVRIGFENINSGYVNSTGKVVIPFRSEVLNEFRNQDLIPVRHGRTSLWGYMDRNGNVSIPQTFEWALPFDESGLAVVTSANGKNYIDKTGTFLLSGNYDFALPFGKGEYSVVTKGKISQIIDRSGRSRSQVVDRIDEIAGCAVRDRAVEKNIGRHLVRLDESRRTELTLDYRKPSL